VSPRARALLRELGYTLDVAVEIVREHGVAVFGPADGRALVNASDPDLLADALALAAPAARAHGRLRVVVDPARV